MAGAEEKHNGQPSYYELADDYTSESHEEDYTRGEHDYKEDWNYWTDGEDTTEAYKGYTGKGKGKYKGKGTMNSQKGTGCSTCGAPWHTAENCPIPTKGRGKGGNAI